mgnify:CR=1 FL=1
MARSRKIFGPLRAQSGSDPADIWLTTSRWSPEGRLLEVTGTYNLSDTSAVEERELTVMLVVDLSGSQFFGSQAALKKDVAVELSAILAFSAMKNNDKVGLILFIIFGSFFELIFSRFNNMLFPILLILLGAVGTLQFEVVQYRLESEYGAPSRLEQTEWKILRWVDPALDLQALPRSGVPAGCALVENAERRSAILHQVELREARIGKVVIDHRHRRRITRLEPLPGPLVPRLERGKGDTAILATTKEAEAGDRDHLRRPEALREDARRPSPPPRCGTSPAPPRDCMSSRTHGCPFPARCSFSRPSIQG